MRNKVPKIPNATEEPTPPAAVDAGAGEEAPATEALKIVITLKDGRGSIGAQRAGCDPFLLSLPDAGLANTLARLPDALAEADARWREQRQYPKYTRPAPPPAPARPVATPSTRSATRGAPSTPGVESPWMF